MTAGRSLQKVLICGIVITIFAACGAERHSDAPRPPSQRGDLVDGVYSASYSHVDNHWWQPFLRARVENGNIAAVQFDYINTVGDLKTADNDYQRRMELETGTYPEDYTSLLESRLITTQNPEVDAVTGASGSTSYFRSLSRAVMSAARRGDRDMVVIPMNETYTAEDSADEREWVGRIAISFEDDGITEIDYDEVVIRNGEVVASKSENDEYAERYSAVYDITPAEAHIELELALRASGDPSTIDAIAGATDTTGRFTTVASWALQKRVSVELPGGDF